MPRLISDNSYVSTDALRGVHIEHHGILGQKWGIRRFRNKDGSLTDAGKKRYGVEESKPKSDDASNRLIAAGFKKDPVYGNYNKGYVSSNGVKHTIEVDLESAFIKNPMTADELDKFVKNIDKNRDAIDEQIRKKIADTIASDPFMIDTAYQNEPNLSSEQKRERLIKDLGKQETYNDKIGLVPGYAHWRILADGLGEVGYDDGGAYGDHYLMADIDWRNMNLSKWVSVNG